MQRSAASQNPNKTLGLAGFDDSKGALSPINMSGMLSPSNMFEQKAIHTN